MQVSKKTNKQRYKLLIKFNPIYTMEYLKYPSSEAISSSYREKRDTNMSKTEEYLNKK